MPLSLSSAKLLPHDVYWLFVQTLCVKRDTALRDVVLSVCMDVLSIFQATNAAVQVRQKVGLELSASFSAPQDFSLWINVVDVFLSSRQCLLVWFSPKEKRWRGDYRRDHDVFG